MLNDNWWKTAHLLSILSHVGLFFSGTFFFIFSPMSFDVPFEVASTLPWFTSGFVSNNDHRLLSDSANSDLQGLFGTISNVCVYSFLANANEATAVDSPSQLYHKRRAAVIGAFIILSFFCVSDLALAVKFSDAANNYELVSSYWVAAVIACAAG